MYRERDGREAPSSPRTLPRPGWQGGGRAWGRSKSPASRPHLSLLLCPEFEGEGGYSSASPSCSPALGRRFPQATSLPRPHALARARGAELLHTSSLPGSPTMGREVTGRERVGREVMGRERVSREAVGRERSLPASPLPRIQVVPADQVGTRNKK